MITLQQATTKLEHIVSWGENRGRISGKMIDEFSGLIASMKELIAFENAYQESDSELSKVTEQLTRVWKLCRMTGLTAKAIAEIENTDDDFLDWYEQHGPVINSNLRFEAFLQMRRSFTVLCETDLNNIRWYAKLRQIAINHQSARVSKASSVSHEIFKNQLQFLHELYHHLTYWFNLIDQGEEIDEMDANNRLYMYHLKN